MKSFIFAVLFLFSQVSLAQVDLDAIMDDNPEATKLEILKLFYHGSVQAAELRDFDQALAPSNQKCRLALVRKNPDELLEILIKQIVKTTPANGPLFPSRSISKLIITHGDLIREVWMRGFDDITISKTETDLVAYHKKSIAHGDSPHKLSLRKNGDLISFQLLTYKNNQDNGPLFEKDVEESYGYCWRE